MSPCGQPRSATVALPYRVRNGDLIPPTAFRNGEVLIAVVPDPQREIEVEMRCGFKEGVARHPENVAVELRVEIRDLRIGRGGLNRSC